MLEAGTFVFYPALRTVVLRVFTLAVTLDRSWRLASRGVAPSVLRVVGMLPSGIRWPSYRIPRKVAS